MCAKTSFSLKEADCRGNKKDFELLMMSEQKTVEHRYGFKKRGFESLNFASMA